MLHTRINAITRPKTYLQVTNLQNGVKQQSPELNQRKKIYAATAAKYIYGYFLIIINLWLFFRHNYIKNHI